MIDDGDREDLSVRLERALLDADRPAAAAALEQARARDGALVVDRVLVPALERIGTDWERGLLALSQVYMAGRICEDLADALTPGTGRRRAVRAGLAIATLEDHHLLGKRIVSATLRAAGWPLQDLGQGMTARALAARVSEGGIRVLLVSTLMLRAALQVKDLVGLLQAAPAPVRVLVGGAPFRIDRDLWREVGADAMGATAGDALDLVEAWAEELG
ncbi:MAG: cobalamin B12-binding domain-containing protein [Deltaproteobacteria bacterium]|nr:cobalamin B12-binding domain-containing protein [Deltaproteobacteria bacterium]